MKLKDRIANWILPRAITAQIALNKVTAPSKLPTERKRLSHLLKTDYQFAFKLGLEELRNARTLAKDPEFPSRLNLLYILEEVLEDSHLFSVLESMNVKVTGSPYAIINENDQIEKDLTDLFERNWVEEYMTAYGEEELYGTTLIEFKEFVKSINKLVEWEVGSVEVFPREHVIPEKGWIVINPIGWVKGIPYREEPWNTYLIEIGKPKNLGKGTKAARNVIVKNFADTDWNQHSEKYGKPKLKIKTAVSDKESLDTTEKNAQNFGANSYIITDIDDEVDMLYQQGTGNIHNIYFDNIKYRDESNSKLFTGQTGIMDTQAWVGSVKAGENMLNERVEARMRRFQRHANAVLIPKLIEFGYPAELANHRFKFLAFIGEKDEDNKGDQEPNDPKPGK